jgi:hypothetical protein
MVDRPLVVSKYTRIIKIRIALSKNRENPDRPSFFKNISLRITIASYGEPSSLRNNFRNQLNTKSQPKSRLTQHKLQPKASVRF